MDNGCIANGLKFKIGKYRIRIWKYGWEYGDDMGGKYYLFPWAPKRNNSKGE